MEPPFWHERWSENQIGFHQEKVNSRLKKLWSALALSVGDRVFVPLCGKTRDMIWLADNSFRVFGVELSEIACEVFFKDNDLEYRLHRNAQFSVYQAQNIEIWAGDFFDLNSEDLAGIAGVYDRASLIALPLPMRQKYVEHLSTLLECGTRVLLISMEYDQNKMQGPPFSVAEDEIYSLFEKEFEIGKVSESAGPDIVGNLKQRGLDTLTEKIFLLTRR